MLVAKFLHYPISSRNFLAKHSTVEGQGGGDSPSGAASKNFSNLCRDTILSWVLHSFFLKVLQFCKVFECPNFRKLSRMKVFTSHFEYKEKWMMFFRVFISCFQSVQKIFRVCKMLCLLYVREDNLMLNMKAKQI